MILAAAFGIAPAAYSQGVEAAESEAAKKAALVIEGEGKALVVPTSYLVKVELSVEEKGRVAVVKEYDRQYVILTAALQEKGYRFSAGQMGDGQPVQILRRTGGTTYTSDNGVDQIGETYRANGVVFIQTANVADIKRAFQTLRATKVPAVMTVEMSAAWDETNRRNALKSAIQNARQRMQAFADAAKPKEFELIFAKEGDFSSGMTARYFSLSEPDIRLPERIEASTSVTLYYGLKSAVQP
jgi:uncharacterized protein YggE